MLLAEIEPGNRLIIELNAPTQKLEFPSKSKGSEKGSLLADAVKVNGKVLGFASSSGMTVNLMLIRQDKSPIVWKNVLIETVKMDTAIIYRISSAAHGFEMNRREAFRLFVGLGGVAQLDINRKADDVIVKDVSETGFAFVSERDDEKLVGKPVRLTFVDMGKQFALMGIIVRRVFISEGKILYGCKISVNNASLAQYINEKQRQLLSMNKDNSVAREKEMLEDALKEKPKYDAESEEDLKKRVSQDEGHKRDLNDVQKYERRDIFKDKNVGKGKRR